MGMSVRSVFRRGHQAAAATAKRPRGLEALLSRAARDGRFRNRLLSDRQAAIEAARVEVSESERSLLLSVPEGRLRQLIENTPSAPRRKFVQASVAWLVALLGGSALVGGCSAPDDEPEPEPVRGTRPDPPVATGIRPE